MSAYRFPNDWDIFSLINNICWIIPCIWQHIFEKYLFEGGVIEGERGRDTMRSSNYWSNSQITTITRAELIWSQEPRAFLDIPWGCKGSSTWGIIYCFPRHMSKEQDYWGSQDSNWYPFGMLTQHVTVALAVLSLTFDDNGIPVFSEKVVYLCKHIIYTWSEYGKMLKFVKS